MKLTSELVTRLALSLKVIGMLGSREEARALYHALVAVVGDAEAQKVLRAAR